MLIKGRKISAGFAEGEALVTRQGISFFGGVDPETGVMVERGHELEGQSIAGRILVFPTGKGSTVGSYTLYRLKHNGKAPAAIINASCETITAVGCIIAEIPCVDQVDLESLHTGVYLQVDGEAGIVKVYTHHSDPHPVRTSSHGVRADIEPAASKKKGAALPPPLGVWEMPSFAHHTVTSRLPKIARETLSGLQAEYGSGVPLRVIEALDSLADEMTEGVIRPLLDTASPDAALWKNDLKPYLGKTWLELPWFFAEMYFYRRVLEACGYYHPGWGEKRDPFTWSKHQGITASLEGTRQLAMLVENWQSEAIDLQTITRRLLLASLWGNQADLSMWAPGKGPTRGIDAGETSTKNQPHLKDGELVADDSTKAANYLAAGLERVDLVVDNTGPELMADLALVDFLLHSGRAKKVVIHAKEHPTFVSDATRPDIYHAAEWLCQPEYPSLERMSQRLNKCLDHGQIKITPRLPGDNFFWHSPHPFWERPGAIEQELAQSELVIFKGDANFRRLLGDLHWSSTTPFGEIIGVRPLGISRDKRPVPILALRVCKSETACGLREGQEEVLFEEDPNWMVDGKWGMALLAD
jgi:predicted aconitase with swiveling domain